MHLHQVLTGAVNPGDNCYSVGSVGDVPFTVSRTGASRRAASDGPTHAPSALGLGRGGGVRIGNHRPRLPGECAGGRDGRFRVAPGSAVPGGGGSGQSPGRFPPAPGWQQTVLVSGYGGGAAPWLPDQPAALKRALCISQGRILAQGNRKICLLPERVRMEVTFSRVAYLAQGSVLIILSGNSLIFAR